MQVKVEIKKFSSSSAAGPDGLRPRPPKTLLGPMSSAQGTRLLTALSNLVNDVLAGGGPKDNNWPLFYGGSLCALTRDCEGIKQVAAGSSLWPLAAHWRWMGVGIFLGGNFKGELVGGNHPHTILIM